MHEGEFIALAVWIPWWVLVAAGDWLWRTWGAAAGFLLAVPAGFLALNLLPYALSGRSPAAQWRLWLCAGVLWAWFHRDAGGIVGISAWGWIVWFGLNSVAVVLLGFRRSMDWGGKAGIAWRVFLLAVLHAAAIGAGLHWGWPWAVAGGATIAAGCCWMVLSPGCQWLGPVKCRTLDRSVLVTIDDGPDPHDTPVLLDLLDRHQVKAVFFMIGEKVAAHPDLAREVVRRGHEIGNHTMTHPQATFWCAGPWRTRREISECRRVIRDCTGVSPRWFRAPVGHCNLFTHPIARGMGMDVMAWSRRGYDAVEKDAAKVLARILTDLGPGDIVLLHEATPIAAEVLEGVLRGAEKASGKSSPGS